MAEVARQHDLTPQQLSNWIKAAKEGHVMLPAPEPDGEFGEATDAAFVPVVALQAGDPREGSVIRDTARQVFAAVLPGRKAEVNAPVALSTSWPHCDLYKSPRFIKMLYGPLF